SGTRTARCSRSSRATRSAAESGEPSAASSDPVWTTELVRLAPAPPASIGSVVFSDTPGATTLTRCHVTYSRATLEAGRGHQRNGRYQGPGRGVDLDAPSGAAVRARPRRGAGTGRPLGVHHAPADPGTHAAREARARADPRDGQP